MYSKALKLCKLQGLRRTDAVVVLRDEIAAHVCHPHLPETVQIPGEIKLAVHKRIARLLIEGMTHNSRRDWYIIAEQPAPAPHLAHPGGRATLRIVLAPERKEFIHYPGRSKTIPSPQSTALR